MSVFDETLPQEFYADMPGNREVTIIKKTTRAVAPGEIDTAAAGVVVDARRRKASRKEKLALNLAYTTPVQIFSVWNDGSRDNFVAPENEDTLVDDDGTSYIIADSEEKILATLWNCLCLKKWEQT